LWPEEILFPSQARQTEGHETWSFGAQKVFGGKKRAGEGLKTVGPNCCADTEVKEKKNKGTKHGCARGQKSWGEVLASMRERVEAASTLKEGQFGATLGYGGKRKEMGGVIGKKKSAQLSGKNSGRKWQPKKVHRGREGEGNIRGGKREVPSTSKGRGHGGEKKKKGIKKHTASSMMNGGTKDEKKKEGYR